MSQQMTQLRSDAPRISEILLKQELELLAKRVEILTAQIQQLSNLINSLL